MKILIVHNYYKMPGGEDIVVENEQRLLKDKGHTVMLFQKSNSEIDVGSFSTKIVSAFTAIWSRSFQKEIKEIARSFSPDIVHVHNTFARISPSIYWAISGLAIPLVQTLHNYRLSCLNALLMRGGLPCEDCVGRNPLPGLRRKCYRNSFSSSLGVFGINTFHRQVGTFRKKIDHFIALTKFSKSILVKTGIPKGKISVKPNFIYDPGHFNPQESGRKNQIIFLGRVEEEKGLDLLLSAWKKVEYSNFKIIIIGDGPQKELLEKKFSSFGDRVIWKGWLDRKDALAEVAKSRFLILPSRWYEGFPMVLVEAMAVGTPVILPNHGGLPEVIHPGESGFLFSANCQEDLARVLEKIVKIKNREWKRLSSNAREEYLERFNPESNYQMLMEIYKSALLAKNRVFNGA